MLYENQTFTDVELQTNGSEFRNCKFTEAVRLVNCKIIDCQFSGSNIYNSIVAGCTFNSSCQALFQTSQITGCKFHRCAICLIDCRMYSCRIKVFRMELNEIQDFDTSQYDVKYLVCDKTTTITDLGNVEKFRGFKQNLGENFVKMINDSKIKEIDVAGVVDYSVFKNLERVTLFSKADLGTIKVPYIDIYDQEFNFGDLWPGIQKLDVDHCICNGNLQLKNLKELSFDSVKMKNQILVADVVYISDQEDHRVYADIVYIPVITNKANLHARKIEICE